MQPMFCSPFEPSFLASLLHITLADDQACYMHKIPLTEIVRQAIAS